jgi:hypothetical protein
VVIDRAAVRSFSRQLPQAELNLPTESLFECLCLWNSVFEIIPHGTSSLALFGDRLQEWLLVIHVDSRYRRM